MHDHRRIQHPLLEPDVRQRALLLCPVWIPSSWREPMGIQGLSCASWHAGPRWIPRSSSRCSSRDDMTPFTLIVPAEGG